MLDGGKTQVDPERFKIVDDRLLVFYDGIWGDTLKRWNDFEEGDAALIGKADQEWESLLDLNNCAALRGARRWSAGEGVSRICVFDPLGHKKAKRRMARAYHLPLGFYHAKFSKLMRVVRVIVIQVELFECGDFPGQCGDCFAISALLGFHRKDDDVVQ